VCLDVSKKNVLNPKKFPALIKKLKENFNVSPVDIVFDEQR